jgi:hypothetical protein
MRLINTKDHSHLSRLDSTRIQTTGSTPINAWLVGHHRRCADANLPSLVLLNGVAGGTPRTAFVVPGPGPGPALIPLPELPLFVLGEEEGGDVAGGRSSIGGKRSLSMSDLRLSYEQVRY